MIYIIFVYYITIRQVGTLDKLALCLLGGAGFESWCLNLFVFVELLTLQLWSVKGKM